MTSPIRVSYVLAAALAATLACSPAALFPSTSTPTVTSGPVFQPPTEPGQAGPTPSVAVSPIILPTFLPTATPRPTTTPAFPWLTGELRVYPGPLHYEGDVLTVEVVVNNLGNLHDLSLATLRIDGEEPLPVTPYPAYSPLREHVLVFRWAWDTTGQIGVHAVNVSISLGESSLPQQIDTFVEILPADRRSAQEDDATWEDVYSACCRLAYVTQTAAERDISRIVDSANLAVAAVERRVGFPVSGKPLPIMLIDNVWGNGAYASSELVISYVDRAYTSLNLDTVIRHEAAHWAMRPLEHQTPTMLVEGVAVHIAEGHYKPEHIPERAAALLTLDLYIPLADLTDNFRAHQHEIAYLEAAGLVAYLTETHSWATFLTFYSLEDIDAEGSEWLDQALQAVYGDDLATVERNYQEWLRAHASEGQAEDLRLTIALFDTVRRYQTLYAPYQESLPSMDAALEAGRVAEFVREPVAVENIALEVMLTQAGRDIQEGRFASAEELIAAVDAALESGNLLSLPVSDYVLIVQELQRAGYEAQQIVLEDDRATVRAIRDWPRIETLTLTFGTTGWQIITGD